MTIDIDDSRPSLACTQCEPEKAFGRNQIPVRRLTENRSYLRPNRWRDISKSICRPHAGKFHRPARIDWVAASPSECADSESAHNTEPSAQSWSDRRTTPAPPSSPFYAIRPCPIGLRHYHIVNPIPASPWLALPGEPFTPKQDDHARPLLIAGAKDHISPVMIAQKFHWQSLVIMELTRRPIAPPYPQANA
jgi:hypothetical protein